MSASQISALSSLAEPIIAEHGCVLEQISIRRAGNRRLVRIVVDAGEGELDLDLVASISRGIARRLDETPVLGESGYVLEVTSPGVDRPLTQDRHWSRAVGRLVRVVRSGDEPAVGRLTSVGPRSIVLDVDGVRTSLNRAEVVRATVQVEFARDDVTTELEDPISDVAGADEQAQPHTPEED